MNEPGVPVLGAELPSEQGDIYVPLDVMAAIGLTRLL